MIVIHPFSLARTNARGVKKGSNKYHVGFSDDGYAAIWKQGTQQPLGFSYRYSFWAFYTKQRGTVPYYVICSGSGNNPDCSIMKAANNGMNAQEYLQFWVYPIEVAGSQQIVLRTKPPNIYNSPNSAPNTFEKDVYISFWATKYGNSNGKFFFQNLINLRRNLRINPASYQYNTCVFE